MGHRGWDGLGPIIGVVIWLLASRGPWNSRMAILGWLNLTIIMLRNKNHNSELIV